MLNGFFQKQKLKSNSTEKELTRDKCALFLHESFVLYQHGTYTVSLQQTVKYMR